MIQNNKLFVGGIAATELAEKFGTPLYAYDAQLIRERYRELVRCIDYRPLKVYYACKANTNKAILSLLREEGAGIDAVSTGEIELALRCGFAPEQIVFTGNNLTDEEMQFGIARGVVQNIDSLSQLARYGTLNPGAKIWVRINPDVGAGHHSHTITGGPDSKFGIYFDRASEIKKIAAQHNLKIVGIHQHIGSGILNPQDFLKAMKVLFSVAKQFPGLECIDFGGGIGIPYRPGEKAIDLSSFGKTVSDEFRAFCREYGSEIAMTIEPGRYLVAEAGVLIARVNTVKKTPAHTFAGVDTGFNHLVRPAMYGSYHEIVKADEVRAETPAKTIVAGNVCESGDVFTLGEHGEKEDRDIAPLSEGDVIGILNAGAYGFSMASTYNTRPRPAEVLVDGKNARIIRARETFDDVIRGMQ